MTMAFEAAPGVPPFIGRYRVVERIGKGAMGMVYAAEDDAMGRRVAVKVMMADLEEEPETRERFSREAKVTGQLLHRNIVTVFDLGDDHGRPYIVMELLAGLPLSDYLRQPQTRTLDSKIDLMMQICEGLQVAHDRGVVHRDIKPSNLFVQHDGALKILDFGVARLATSNLTASGFLVGTPDYMSPEQAQGQQVDARSDVFSAAGVFYYMLTGRAPFASPDLPKILHAVMHEHPAPLTDADAPEPLRRVLVRALAKAPHDRYQACSEMLVDLERVRRAQDGETRRIAQAGLDRYRRIVAVIDDRRLLGRSLGIADSDRSCDTALARLAARFPAFAKYTDESALMEPMDRAVAQVALAALQTRHNMELAALEALRAQAVDSVKRPAVADISDVTLLLPARDGGMRAESASLRARAARWWRRFLGQRGQSTTEWLMIAGVLSAIGIFLVGIMPHALGVFMKSMAMSLRTVAP